MAKKKFKQPVKQLPAKPGVPPAAAPNAPAAASKAATPAQPVAPTGDAIDSSDPLIAKVQDAVRAKLPPKYRVAVQRIVLAGMKVMFSPETHQLMLQAIRSDTDPAHAVGMGVTQLLTLLFKESKGSMPIPAIVPGGVLLCCEALDFMEKAGMVKVTPQIIDDTVQTVTAYLMQKLGYTPDQMARIAQGGAQGGAPAPQGAQPAAPQGAAPASAPAPASQGLIAQQMGAQ
jgi:hypothetical protein